jgi:hypothetical protein
MGEGGSKAAIGSASGMNPCTSAHASWCVCARACMGERGIKMSMIPPRLSLPPSRARESHTHTCILLWGHCYTRNEGERRKGMGRGRERGSGIWGGLTWAAS